MSGVFSGATILMIRVYRLDWRQVLAARPVRPVVWIVVLVLIAVSQMTGSGVLTLANEIFPFPEELLEEFARQIIPEAFPLWKVLLMIAITPGHRRGNSISRGAAPWPASSVTSYFARFGDRRGVRFISHVFIQDYPDRIPWNDPNQRGCSNGFYFPLYVAARRQ